MRYHKKIYCEFGFWSKLTAMGEDSISLLDDNGMQKHIAWVCLMQMLLSKGELCFKSSDKTLLAEHDNKYTKKLQKRKTEGRKISFVSNFPDVRNASSEDELSALYLCDDAASITTDSRERGILVITPATIDKVIGLNKDNGLSIHQNDSGNWSFLATKTCTCNSAIIMDLYAYQSEINKREINLYAILDSILPKSLSVPFHLSIFTNDQSSSIENQKIEISKWLTNNRKHLCVNLMMYRTTNADIHDRSIVTNNQWIKSGAGFDLYKPGGRAGKTTDVNIAYPYLQQFSDVVDSSYELVLEDASRIHRISGKDDSEKNRLIATFEQQRV